MKVEVEVQRQQCQRRGHWRRQKWWWSCLLWQGEWRGSVSEVKRQEVLYTRPNEVQRGGRQSTRMRVEKKVDTHL
jgi:hypothetical protein